MELGWEKRKSLGGREGRDGRGKAMWVEGSRDMRGKARGGREGSRDGRVKARGGREGSRNGRV
jgi:hypothetical protein